MSPFVRFKIIVPCSGKGQGRSVLFQMRAHQCDNAHLPAQGATEQWERIQETLSAQELTSAAAAVRAKPIDRPAGVSSHLLLSHFLLERRFQRAPTSSR